jgi:predicted porin
MKLKKLASATALAATVTTPAFADEVQLYGKLYPYLLRESLSNGTLADGGKVQSSLNATRAAADNSTHMQSANSNFGVRGTENIGGGLKVIFQLESQLALEDGSTSAKFWSRNTFVGMDGPWGTVKLGHHDSVFKEYGDTIAFLGVSSGSFTSLSNMSRMAGFGNSSQSRFHDRVENMIRYDSPRFANFQLGVLYSNDSTDKTQVQADKKPKNLSLGVNWDNGPIYLALAHEIHWNDFGGSSNVASSMRNTGTTITGVGSKDQATQATIEWRINKRHRVEFDVIHKSYHEDQGPVVLPASGTFNSYKNFAYQLAIEDKWNERWTTVAHVVYAAAGSCSLYGNPVCSTSGLAATRYMLGFGYNFSKRTMLYGAVVYIRNGKASSYNNGYAKIGAGQNVTDIGLGLMHRF